MDAGADDPVVGAEPVVVGVDGAGGDAGTEDDAGVEVDGALLDGDGGVRDRLGSGRWVLGAEVRGSTGTLAVFFGSGRTAK